MSEKKMRAITLLSVLGVGAVASTPAYACHSATGWCCVESSSTYYCCYYENDQLQRNTCGYLQPPT